MNETINYLSNNVFFNFFQPPPPQKKENCSDVALDILMCIENELWENELWENPKLKYFLNSDFYKLPRKLEKIKISCNDDELLQKKTEKIKNDINKNGLIITVFDNKTFFSQDLYKKLTFEKTIYYHFIKMFCPYR
jgi:hypothetical protein